MVAVINMYPVGDLRRERLRDAIIRTREDFVARDPFYVRSISWQLIRTTCHLRTIKQEAARDASFYT